VTIEFEQTLHQAANLELYAKKCISATRGSLPASGDLSQASVAYFGKDLRQLSLPELPPI